ncbi:unnamed protein product [Prorocentrum cordatum]|uniref:Uncharacterized protein n=1 Tax=Prorocentrum cordatum TaxID=2364126 RepID=A0ABN9VJ59_9DINO|nr:unnamed protein product [Polarella glacialis]
MRRSAYSGVQSLDSVFGVGAGFDASQCLLSTFWILDRTSARSDALQPLRSGVWIPDSESLQGLMHRSACLPDFGFQIGPLQALVRSGAYISGCGVRTWRGCRL